MGDLGLASTAELVGTLVFLHVWGRWGSLGTSALCPSCLVDVINDL